jgi:anti-sigma factor RsiW
MDCDDVRPLLEPFHDGELAAADRQVVEAHLAGCPACRGELRSLTETAELVRRHGRFRLPDDLADGIRAALPGGAGGAPGRPLPRRWLAAGLAACAGAAGLGLWVGRRDRPGPLDLIARDVLAAHQRSLVASTPVDLASADPHTVKPWLTARLQFAPPVGDAAALGFTLDGARVDHVDGRSVAAFALHRRAHRVSLLVWPVPGEPDRDPGLLRRGGFALVSWVRDGFAFWAVSDLNARELAELAAGAGAG